MTGYVVRNVSNNFSFACVNKLETSLPQTKFTASLVTYGSDLAVSAMKLINVRIKASILI